MRKAGARLKNDALLGRILGRYAIISHIDDCATE